MAMYSCVLEKEIPMSDIPNDTPPVDKPSEAAAPPELPSPAALAAIQTGESTPSQPPETGTDQEDTQLAFLEQQIKIFDARLQSGEAKDQPEERKALLQMATEAQNRLNVYIQAKQSKSS
jgi:hypothetical protein